MICIKFERWRTPPEIIMYSLNLYLGFRMSLRDAREHLLDEWGFERSHPGRRWVHRANRAARRYFQRPLKRASHIVLDESRVRVGGEWVWLWVAPGPPEARGAPGVYLSKTRNGLIARSFMKKLMGKYAWVVFVTDGGKWYPWAAESLGARWVWLRGGVSGWSAGSAP